MPLRITGLALVIVMQHSRYNVYPKNRITNVEATVVLKLNQGTRREMDVIFRGCPFFVTFFWQAKKVKDNHFTSLGLTPNSSLKHLLKYV